jgi:hypothetical protein
MATIVKYITDNKNISPVLYIDSINKSCYVEEMLNYTIRYIRETTNNNINNRDNYISSSMENIYNKCKDGYWITIDDQDVSLYKKETLTGIFYNSIQVGKIFTLKYVLCPRIVPKILKKQSLFDNFTDELKASVNNYKTRSRIEY